MTATLAPLRVQPHKDARAPQNLYPIGGLERVLRHRLGDAQVCYRALRRRATHPWFQPLDTLGRLARWTSIERQAVIDQALPPSVSQATGDIVEIAKDAIEGVRGWAGEVAEQARDKVSPKPKKKRSKLPLLLVAARARRAAFYFVLKRAGAAPTSSRRRTTSVRPWKPRTAAKNGERAPLSTPQG